MDAIKTISEYQPIDDKTSDEIILKIVEDDMEIYMVYPSSACPQGWKGWGSQVINKKIVPIPCQ